MPKPYSQDLRMRIKGSFCHSPRPISRGLCALAPESYRDEIRPRELSVAENEQRDQGSCREFSKPAGRSSMKKWLLKSIEQYGAVVFVVAAICLTLLWAGALVLMVKELV